MSVFPLPPMIAEVCLLTKTEYIMRIYSITHQGAFDKVVRYFVYNKMPISYKSTGGCFYRMPDPVYGTLKCSIGILIPDAIYDPEMEEKGIGMLTFMYPNVDRRFVKILLEDLINLQHLHDRSWRGRTSCQIAETLVDYAEQCGLHISARLRAAAGQAK